MRSLNRRTRRRGDRRRIADDGRLEVAVSLREAVVVQVWWPCGTPAGGGGAAHWLPFGCRRGSGFPPARAVDNDRRLVR